MVSRDSFPSYHWFNCITILTYSWFSPSFFSVLYSRYKLGWQPSSPSLWATSCFLNAASPYLIPIPFGTLTWCKCDMLPNGTWPWLHDHSDGPRNSHVTQAATVRVLSWDLPGEDLCGEVEIPRLVKPVCNFKEWGQCTERKDKPPWSSPILPSQEPTLHKPCNKKRGLFLKLFWPRLLWTGFLH